MQYVSCNFNFLEELVCAFTLTKLTLRFGMKQERELYQLDEATDGGHVSVFLFLMGLCPDTKYLLVIFGVLCFNCTLGKFSRSWRR